MNSILHLTTWTRVLEKLFVTQLIKKFPAFYGTWRFTTVFTRARHWSLFRAECIQSAPSLRSAVILSSHQRLGLPSDPSLLVFRRKSWMNFSSPMGVTCPSHLILFDLNTQIIKDDTWYKYRSNKTFAVSLNGRRDHCSKQNKNKTVL
jgi:hypothetical protein